MPPLHTEVNGATLLFGGWLSSGAMMAKCGGQGAQAMNAGHVCAVLGERPGRLRLHHIIYELEIYERLVRRMKHEIPTSSRATVKPARRSDENNAVHRLHVFLRLSRFVVYPPTMLCSPCVLRREREICEHCESRVFSGYAQSFGLRSRIGKWGETPRFYLFFRPAPRGVRVV